MKPDILQHHQPIDIKVLFEKFYNGMIALDSRDYELFFHAPGKKHSFTGIGSGSDRVKNAIDNAAMTPDFQTLIEKADKLIIMILKSSEATMPLMINECAYITDYVATLPADMEITWAVADDSTLGNDIRVIILLNIPE